MKQVEQGKQDKQGIPQFIKKRKTRKLQLWTFHTLVDT